MTLNFKRQGLQARFITICSAGMLALAACTLIFLGWFEFAGLESKLRTFAENELRSLNSLVESAMEQRLSDSENVAIKVFNGWFESRNREYPGKLWSVWDPKTRAYMAKSAPEQAAKLPLDAIDEEALKTGRPVGRFVGGAYRYSLPIIQGHSAGTKKDSCAGCHTGMIGQKDGHVIAVFSSSVTAADDIAGVWRYLLVAAGGGVA